MKWINLYITFKSISSILAFSQFPGRATSSSSSRHPVISTQSFGLFRVVQQRHQRQQQHHLNEAVKAVNNGEEESSLDKKLREFFSESRHFTVAKRVMDTVLTNNNDDKSTKLTKPLLFKLPLSHEAVQCDTMIESTSITTKNYDTNESKNEKQQQWFKNLFDPLFFANNLNNKSLEDDPQQRQKEVESCIKSQQSKGQNFKISIAYRGSAFCGWQIQPDNEKASVQQTLIDILDPLLGSRNTDSDVLPIHNKETKQHNDKTKKGSLVVARRRRIRKPIDIRVCGRTDAGVSAIGQVCRVRTLRTSDEIDSTKIQNAINESIEIKCNDQESERTKQRNLYCSSVTLVNDKFHPTFGATSRAYAYIIDVNSIDELLRSCIPEDNYSGTEDIIQRLVHNMNEMVMRIEHLELDYFALSFGKVKTSTTLCTLYRARVSQVQLISNDDNMDTSTCNDTMSAKKQQGICFEFVGNRFLRRMIRIMVSTLLRLALESLIIENDSVTAEINDRFLDLVQSLDRKQSAKPANAGGLIFVGASFE